MPTDTVISQRKSALAALGVPLPAAVLAADAAVPTGFAPQDVRFFFLLFSNWMGDDHLRPGADLDATQVRRTLQTLAAAGLATGVAGRPPRWSLTADGVVRLVDTLTDPRAPRRFEEVVLLVTVATSYAGIITRRAAGRGGADERRVRARLDPRAILRAERRRLSDALVDLEARRDAGPRLAEAARAALAAGADPVAAAGSLEAQGLPYQLHPMRPYGELIAALPPALARFEVEEGLALRARTMFGPLAEELRARIGILERLEGTLGAGNRAATPPDAQAIAQRSPGAPARPQP
jgi:hypothetical protein